jgi:hypothetical protein
MNFEDTLNTGAGNAFKFAAPGVTIAGTVTAKNIVNRPNLDGVPEDVPVIQILDGDNVEWDIWLGKAAMRSAVGHALTKHGAGTKLEIGGKLAIKRTEDGQATKVGFSAPHRFEAQYVPPAAPAPAEAPAGGDATASDLFG